MNINISLRLNIEGVSLLVKALLSGEEHFKLSYHLLKFFS